MAYRNTIARFPLRFLLILCVTLAQLATLTFPATAQTLPVVILDAHNTPLTTLIDGNSISVKISLPQAASASTAVDFQIEGLTAPIASCTILAGQDTCQTAIFPALGWAWAANGVRKTQRIVQAQSAGQVLGESAILAITPRPVVLVHGFNTDWKLTWGNYLGADGYLAASGFGLHGYAVGDGQVPGVMDTGNRFAPLARTNTIAQNAAIMSEYIRNVQQVTGAEQVDVVVHSMGGIIARYYLDRMMQTRNVAQLILLGSPMAGSACAVLSATLGLFLPASLELQPSYLQAIFNPQITRRQGVPFHALAGTSLRNPVQSPCADVPSDLVVPLTSVKAIAMPVREIAILHIDLPVAPEVFSDFVRPLLQTPPGDGWQVADPPLPPPPAEVLQFTRVYTGHLQPGETQSVTIQIDPGVTVATFALYDTSRSLTTTVTGASGKRVVLDPTANGEMRVTDPASLVYLGYGFVQPTAGQWIVALQTTAETPATGADYAIAARFNGGATLQTTLDKLVPQVNEPVTLQAQLIATGQSITLTSAQARVRRPDGQVESYPLVVQGEKTVFTLTPIQSGLYGVEVNVSAQTEAGLTIDRAAFAVFEAQPTVATGRFNLVILLLLVLLLFPLLLLPILLLL
jgi:pimeloyl-ACP methyl ester carboxylesterase